jgi:hypothetical protein
MKTKLPLHVLLLEDNPHDAELIEAILQPTVSQRATLDVVYLSRRRAAEQTSTHRPVASSATAASDGAPAV